MIADQEQQHLLDEALIIKIQKSFFLANLRKQVIELYLYEQKQDTREVKKYYLSLDKQTPELKYFFDAAELFREYFQERTRPFQINDKYELIIRVETNGKSRQINLKFHDAFEENQQKLSKQFSRIADDFNRIELDKNSYIDTNLKNDEIFSVNLYGDTIMFAYLEKKEKEIFKYELECTYNQQKQELKGVENDDFKELLENGVREFFDQYFMEKKYKFEFNKDRKQIIFDQIITKNNKQKTTHIPVRLPQVNQEDKLKLYDEFTLIKINQMEKKLSFLQRSRDIAQRINIIYFDFERSHYQDFLIQYDIITRVRKTNKQWSEMCIKVSPELFKNQIYEEEFKKIQRRGIQKILKKYAQIQLLPVPINSVRPVKINEIHEIKPRKFYIKVKDTINGKYLILYNTGYLQNSQGVIVMKSKDENQKNIRVSLINNKIVRFQSGGKEKGSQNTITFVPIDSEKMLKFIEFNPNMEFYIGISQYNVAYTYKISIQEQLR